MPYPAPADVLAVSGLRWLLVAIPDDPAYGQAAIEQYVRLADVWNWGLEGTHPDAEEIRQQWLTAVDETLRALELGFPDTLLEILQVIRDNADEVEGLLRGLRDLSGCCDETDPTGGDFYTDDWNDGDPVPQPIIDAGFAEDLNDQAGYTDYKCLIANVAVDDLIQKTLKWADLFDSAGNVVGGIAAVAAIAAGIIGVLTSAPAWIIAGGILAVTGNIARIYDWLTSTGETGVRTTAEAFEAIRDDVVCAIYQADGMTEAVAAALAVLQGEVSAAVYAWASLVLPLTIKALYAGRYNETDTAQALVDAGFTLSTFDCDNCADPDLVITYTFDTDREAWTGSPNPTWVGAQGCPDAGSLEFGNLDPRSPAFPVPAGATEGRLVVCWKQYSGAHAIPPVYFRKQSDNFQFALFSHGGTTLPANWTDFDTGWISINTTDGSNSYLIVDTGVGFVGRMDNVRLYLR